jgi:Skp family chaperone for outer membrane proteins
MGYVGSRLTAQQAGTAASAAAPRSTRVAMLNLAYVIKNYQKYVAFQNEMKGAVKQFEEKINAKKAMLEQMSKEAQTAQPERKDQLLKQATSLQRELEDLNNDAKNYLGKKGDEQMVILYREVQDASQRYALAQGIDLVLHYTDATTPQEASNPMTIARKLQSSGCMPLYWTQGVDISYDVVMALNTAYGGGKAAPPATNNTPATTTPGGQ